MNIPDKDLKIIQGVADHVTRRRTVPGMGDEDMRQELTLLGMEQYANNWNESKQKGKVEAKRDNNLRIYLRTFMFNRVANMLRGETTKKKGGGEVTVTSIDTQDEAFASLFRENGDGTFREFDVEGLGVTDEQVKVLMYIAGNNLGIGGATGSTTQDLANEVGVDKSRVRDLIEDLKGNDALKKMLQERLT